MNTKADSFCSSPSSSNIDHHLRQLPVPSNGIRGSGHGTFSNHPDIDILNSTSRLRNVLIQAGAVTSTVSEESMRKMKYCLECIQVSCLLIEKLSLNMTLVCIEPYKSTVDVFERARTSCLPRPIVYPNGIVFAQ
jgi:hypothetical protein